jgi:S1-C subfamily serine protease
VVIALAGVIAGRASSSQNNAPQGPSGSPSAAPGLASRVDPSLVDVYTVLGLEGEAAAGTGMVLTSSGEVLTNNHVVEGATSVRVTDVGNGRSYDATVVGTDKTDDIAVLHLSGASGLATVSLGDSSKLAVGDAVTAIGNAGGGGGTPSVTTGNVTALGQSIVASDQVDGSEERLRGLVQTDAALAPGDSGGPLLDNSAHVIAVDTAASSNYQFQSGTSASFAIPVNLAMSLARQIESGVSSSSVHIGPAALLGVSVEGSTGTAGALVAGVQNGSPAKQIGIVSGDVITSLGGAPVDSPTSLSGLMAQHHPGDNVSVVWTGIDGRLHTATARLVEGPAT